MDIIYEINKLEYIKIEDDKNGYYSIRFSGGFSDGKLVCILDTVANEYQSFYYNPYIEKQLILHHYTISNKDLLDIVVKNMTDKDLFEKKIIPKDMLENNKIKKSKRQIFILNGDE